MNRFLRAFTNEATLWPDAAVFHPLAPGTSTGESDRVKALLVVAHPDDESECAMAIYRITHELGGIVDQVIVTNGEAGSQYSAPAEAYYRLSLCTRGVGRNPLPRIRRKELLRAGQVLGIRHHYFLEEKDTGFTLDPQDGLTTWNLRRVRGELQRLLAIERYDLVLMVLPTKDTHGHHQSVAVLTLEATATLGRERRPVALGVQSANDWPHFCELEGFPATRSVSSEPAWILDRRTALRGHPSLDYSIVVNWVIAEHKSQGLFQMEFGRKIQECFWLFALSGQCATGAVQPIFEARSSVAVQA